MAGERTVTGADEVTCGAAGELWTLGHEGPGILSKGIHFVLENS